MKKYNYFNLYLALQMCAVWLLTHGVALAQSKDVDPQVLNDVAAITFAVGPEAQRAWLLKALDGKSALYVAQLYEELEKSNKIAANLLITIPLQPKVLNAGDGTDPHDCNARNVQIMQQDEKFGY